MKQSARSLDPRTRAGQITLIPEDAEDMWHLFNIIHVQDRIRSTTLRKVITEGSTGTTEAKKIKLTLAIQIEGTMFDANGGGVRCSGKTVEENKDVRLGSYHTIDIDLHKPFTLAKDEWDSVTLERIDNACDITKKAEIAAIIMDDGNANVCLLTESMSIVRQKIQFSIPKKHKGSSAALEKGLQKFYEAVYSAMLKHLDMQTIKAVILASPGFTKESFYRYIIAEASKSGNRTILDNKAKFLQIHCSSYHKQALLEVLKDPTIVARLSDTKYAQEVRAINEFTNMLSDDEDRAYYGIEHVAKALDRGAIRTLLVSDSLFRSEDIATRRKYIKMVEDVRSMGKVALIFSSLHASELNQLTGIAAILQYPITDIDDQI